MGLKSFWQYKTCLKYSLVHLQVMTIRHLFVREYECFVLRLCIFYRFFYRDVGKGGGGQGSHAPSPQILVDQLALSQPGGANYAHQIILAPPDFQTFLRPCHISWILELLIQSLACMGLFQIQELFFLPTEVRFAYIMPSAGASHDFPENHVRGAANPFHWSVAFWLANQIA